MAHTVPLWPSLAPDLTLAERRAALWRMTPEQRVAAMRRGELRLDDCLHWASRRPHEVPLVNGEWDFIAALTPEVADD